jgi:hypothetical protein
MLEGHVVAEEVNSFSDAERPLCDLFRDIRGSRKFGLHR